MKFRGVAETFLGEKRSKGIGTLTRCVLRGPRHQNPDRGKGQPGIRRNADVNDYYSLEEEGKPRFSYNAFKEWWMTRRKKIAKEKLKLRRGGELSLGAQNQGGDQSTLKTKSMPSKMGSRRKGKSFKKIVTSGRDCTHGKHTRKKIEAQKPKKTMTHLITGYEQAVCPNKRRGLKEGR